MSDDPTRRVDAAIDEAYEEGRQEERGLVVAYLERIGMTLATERIARGAHMDVER